MARLDWFRLTAGILLSVILMIGRVTSAAADEKERVDALNKQMMQLYSEGRYEEATPLATQVLAILQRALGLESPEVASAYNNLAELHVKQHHYAEAEPLYKRSLVIRQRALGPTNPDTVKSLNRLADLYKLEGKEAEAAALLEPAKPQRESMPRPGPPVARVAPPPQANPNASKDIELATQLNKQMAELDQQKRYAEAVPIAVQLLAILEKTYGPDDTNVSVIAANLAHLYSQLRQHDLAEPLYKRRLATLKKTLGPNNPEVVIANDELVDCYRRLGKDKEGKPLITDTMTNRDKIAAAVSAKDTPIAAPNKKDLEHEKELEHHIFELSSQGHFADALPVATELQSLLEKMYGPDGIVVAMNLDSLATIYKSLGRFSEAEAFARRSQAIRDKARADEYSKGSGK